MQKKCIIVGVTGGIAAFKACSLVSHLVKQGHEVHVLMTKGATEFVSPLTFQTLAKTRVILDMFSVDYEPDVHHISLAEKADVCLSFRRKNVSSKTRLLAGRHH